MQNKKYWAIDLGTTNSTIAWTDQDKSEIIKVKGNSSLPSVILVKNGMMESVKKRNKQLYKSLEEEKASTIEKWKIKGMASSQSAMKDFDETVPDSSPIKLSSMILETLIEEAESKTGSKVENLSITVPANFSEAAKLNTLSALKRVRPTLRSVKLVNEPTAAAMSLLGGVFNIDEIIGEKVLVFDMGGGTTDISLVNFELNDQKMINANIIGTKGIDMAGEAIDEMILNKYVFPAINKKHKIDKEDIIKEPMIYQKLMYVAEYLKIQLAKEQDDACETMSFKFNGKKCKTYVEIDYFDFLEDVHNMLANILDTLKKLLVELKIAPKEIDKVVVAGGSSKAPWIKTILNDFFNRKVVKSVLDPDTAIAIGGSIISAANFTDGILKYKSNKIMVNEIVPNNIGLGVWGRKVSWLLDRGENIPAVSKTKEFEFTEDGMGDDEITLGIYENKMKKNFISEAELLGVLVVKNNKKTKDFSLTFKYELDNSFHVTISQDGEENEYEVMQSGKQFDVKKESDEFAHNFAKKKYLKNGSVSIAALNKTLKEMDKRGLNVSAYADINNKSEEAKKLIISFKHFCDITDDLS